MDRDGMDRLKLIIESNYRNYRNYRNAEIIDRINWRPPWQLILVPITRTTMSILVKEPIWRWATRRLRHTSSRNLLNSFVLRFRLKSKSMFETFDAQASQDPQTSLLTLWKAATSWPNVAKVHVTWASYHQFAYYKLFSRRLCTVAKHSWIIIG